MFSFSLFVPYETNSPELDRQKMNRMCVCFAGLGGTPAQMGFDAGDRKNKYSDPRSRKGEILGLQDNKYIFPIRSHNVVNHFLPFV